MFRTLARNWFPLALAGLFLLGLPGAVLFALHLLGRSSGVNKWLEERVSLSFLIALPVWASLLLFLVPLLLILLYFLKLKRKSLAVPSTFLWKKTIEDLRVNSLFQWLRNNVLLLLQLLAVLAMIYAILAPRFHGAGQRGKHYILMIDNSASMSATDLGSARLEAAKDEAIKEIDAATDDDFGMLIVFNSRAEIRQSYTSNRFLLRQRVRAVEPTERPTRLEEALHLADGLANPQRSTENESVRPPGEEPGQARTYVAAEGIKAEVHLFSDGRFADVPDFALGNLDLKYHPVGKQGRDVDNIAIVNFNALRDETDPNKLQVFVRVSNYRPTPAKVKLELRARVEGGAPRPFEQVVDLPARKVDEVKDVEKDEVRVNDQPGDASAVFELTDIDDRAEVILHARLAGHKDAFPLDDQAFLVVGVVRKARILIATPNNFILKAFFDDAATQAVADVTWIFPEEINKAKAYTDAKGGAFDLVIFDRCGPAREDDLPRANTVFIAQPPPPLKKGEMVKNPRVTGWMNRHAAMRFLVGLQEIGIDESFPVKELPPRTPVLLEGEGNSALMFALPRGAFTDIVQTFPILDDAGNWNTLWPLQPSFPLFWRNVLYAYGNVSDAAGEENVQPGNPKLLRPGGLVNQLRVLPPEGAAVTLDRGTRADFDFQQTDQIGVYRAEWGDNLGRSFAVNLLDPDESNLEPRTSVKVGLERVEGGPTRRQPRDLWKWAVLAALGVLLAEWYVYNKRVYV
jgi:von Willebrand factor type A domain/Aerotolerance regulator N-terminal